MTEITMDSYNFIVWAYAILDKTLCNTKKSTFIFPFSPFPSIQCCRVAIVGSLVEHPVSRCVIQH